MFFGKIFMNLQKLRKKMEKIDKKILLLINWKNRDLRPVIQVGTYLKMLGYLVYYSNHSNALWNIFIIKPNLIVFPQVIAEKDKAILAKKIGSKICVIRSEGIVTDNSIKDLFKFDGGVDIDEFVDLYIVWGPKFKELIMKHINISEKKIKVCGNPRFDIYRKPLSDLTNLFDIETIGLKKRKKLILFASNFVYLDKDYQMAIKNYGEEIDNIIKERKELFQTINQNFKKFFSLHKEIQLLIKLHPLELGDKYNSLVELENVFLIKDLDISLLLNYIDVLIHTNSTVNLEAAMVDKPILTFLNDNINPKHLFENVRHLPKITNYEQLENQIFKYLNQPFEIKYQKVQTDYIFEWFYKIDGNATIRCVQEIDNFINSLPSLGNLNKQKIGIKYFLKIIQSTPIVHKLINYLSILKHGGKKPYYSRIHETELVNKTDIKNMEKIIEDLFKKTNYFRKIPSN